MDAEAGRETGALGLANRGASAAHCACPVSKRCWGAKPIKRAVGRLAVGAWDADHGIAGVFLLKSCKAAALRSFQQTEG